MFGNTVIVLAGSSECVSKPVIYLPVLGDVEGPLESQMRLAVIIYKGRNCIVMTTGDHS